MNTFHLEQQIIRDIQDKAKSISTFKDQVQVSLLSKVDPKILDKGYVGRVRSIPKRMMFGSKCLYLKKSPSLKPIHILLSFFAHNHIRFHQMDVNSAYLNGIINEKKALHGLKQAPHALYGKLSSLLRISMGELKIKQTNDGIFIDETKYANEILKKFKFDDCKSISTPMHPTSIMSLDDSYKKVDQTIYRDMIGSVLYLTTSRPNIMTFEYLKDFTNLRLLFKKSDEYMLIGCFDVNYARYVIDKKKAPVEASKRQGIIALSTVKVKYIVVGFSSQY
ncbi:putative mitochondrial protein, partial [Mucuna pruriens]